MVKVTAEAFLGHIGACLARGDRSTADMWAKVWHSMAKAGTASFLPVDIASVPSSLRPYLPTLRGFGIFSELFDR